MSNPTQIQSRDNALLKELRRLAHANTEYRKQARFWVEGDHLLRAGLDRGIRPVIGVFAQSAWVQLAPVWGQVALKTVLLSDDLFDELSALESPARMGFVFELPEQPVVQAKAATVILDRVQDAGNVGAILRSASAFGFKQVLALTGTAALWSPKVLRAGMGAHWGVHLHEGLAMQALKDLDLPLLVTSSHRGEFLHHMLQQRQLPMPCAWALGHEGQGVCDAIADLASYHVRIAQPGGEESLNVATAAAICLHASATVGMV